MDIFRELRNLLRLRSTGKALPILREEGQRFLEATFDEINQFIQIIPQLPLRQGASGVEHSLKLLVDFTQAMKPQIEAVTPQDTEIQRAFLSGYIAGIQHFEQTYNEMARQFPGQVSIPIENNKAPTGNSMQQFAEVNARLGFAASHGIAQMATTDLGLLSMIAPVALTTVRKAIVLAIATCEQLKTSLSAAA